MNELRLATLEEDSWCLRNGEDVHREHPETFWIPDERVRRSLSRGTEVKVMFEMEGLTEDGAVETSVERMWVVVTERIGNRYLGILSNQPFSLDPDDEEVYLRFGAEVPFAPEHVIDALVDEAPREDVDVLAANPVCRWPR